MRWAGGLQKLHQRQAQLFIDAIQFIIIEAKKEHFMA